MHMASFEVQPDYYCFGTSLREARYSDSSCAWTMLINFCLTKNFSVSICPTYETSEFHINSVATGPIRKHDIRYIDLRVHNEELHTRLYEDYRI